MTSRLARYTKRSNYYYHNKLFKTNRTQFYRSVCDSGNNIHPSPPPNEALQFWKGICDPNNQSFETPVWFSDIEKTNESPSEIFSVL